MEEWYAALVSQNVPRLVPQNAPAFCDKQRKVFRE
jgi:hypothetical protein